LAVLFEFPWRLEQLAGFSELNARLLEGIWLAVIALEQRLGIESVHVTGTTFHEEKHHPLGASGQVWLLGCEGVRSGRFDLLGGHHRLEGQETEAPSAALEHGST
jgi:hypothetical protein